MIKKCFSTCFIIISSLLIFSVPLLSAFEVTDDLDRTVSFRRAPKRVVSLSPVATEIILALGAENVLKGVSSSDSHFEGLIGRPVAGSPVAAHPALIEGLKPDLLIVEPALAPEILNGPLAALAPVLALGGPSTLARAEARIEDLGRLLNRTREAQSVLDEQREHFRNIDLKVKKLNLSAAPKTIYLAAEGEQLLTYGSSSFHNSLIIAAGGQPPAFASAPGPEKFKLKNSDLVDFNPDVIYSCQKYRRNITKILSNKSFSNVLAVKNARIKYYPCSLTDRAAAHAGYFAAWLSSGLFAEEYGDPKNLVRDNQIIGQRPIAIDIPYVSQAKIVYARLNDFVQKTLLIEFASPQTVLSTADGPRTGVTVVGNGSSPPMVWDINHQGGWEADLAARYEVLGLDEKTSSLIFTGADMDDLAIVTKTWKDIKVTALVTAGAESNAVRTGQDEGAFYEPGTINIIVLSSRALSEAGAARAMITVTEAKTAALWDLDVRSSQTPLVNPATGTGTDSIILVAGGKGRPVDYTGGHGKIGEVMAEAVYEAVLKALAKGNGLAKKRNLFVRLAERGLDLETSLSGPDAAKLDSASDLCRKMTLTLLEEKYAGLAETALALDDALIMGHVGDSSGFVKAVETEAAALAGSASPIKIRALFDPALPPMLRQTFDAIGSGLLAQK